MSKQVKASRPADTAQFAEFWAAYPRKEAKGAARKSFEKAIKLTTFEEIMSGLNRQLPILAGREPQYIPHPTTWLNQERWEDELQPIKARPQQRRTIADVAREMDARWAGFDAPVSLPSLTRN